MSRAFPIKPWIFEFMPALDGFIGEVDPKDINSLFDEYLAMWERAEELGFEGIFFSEHHFWMSYSPSPNLLIAALASRTKYMRLGTMGMVVPFYCPWRVLEEIFMLDHLTKGRLEIGCSMGVPQEFTRVGIELDEMRARFDETLDIIDAGLAAPVFSHHGRFWKFDDLSILPRPLQHPGPPKWTTVVSTGSAEKSAARGSKICTSFHSIDRVNEIFDVYRGASDRLGNSVGPDHLGLRRNVSIDRNGAEAEAMAKAAYKNTMNLLSGGASSAGVKSGDSRFRTSEDQILDAPQGTFSIHEDEFIAGTPAQVAEQIIEQCRACGCSNFLANLGRGSNTRRSDIVELFGKDVVPVLRSAAIG